MVMTRGQKERCEYNDITECNDDNINNCTWDSTINKCKKVESEDGSGSDVESEEEKEEEEVISETQVEEANETQANETQEDAKLPTNETPEQSEYNTKDMIINLHVVNDKEMGNIIILETGNKYTIDGDKISLESTMSNLELHNEMDVLCNNMNATRISFIETLREPTSMQDILQKHLEGYNVVVKDEQTFNDPNVTEIPFKELLIKPNYIESILSNKLNGFKVEINKYPFIGNVTTNNMIIQLTITNKKMFNGTITTINTRNQYTIKNNQIDANVKDVDDLTELIDEYCNSKHPARIKTITTPKDMGEIFTKYLSEFNVNVQRKIMFDDNYDTLLNNIQKALIINGSKISVHGAYAGHRPDQYDPKNYLDSDYDINKDPYPLYLDEGEGLTEGVKEIKKIVEEIATLIYKYPRTQDNKKEAVELLEQLNNKPIPQCKSSGFDENWKKCKFTLEKQYYLAHKMAGTQGFNDDDDTTKTKLVNLNTELKNKGDSIGFQEHWSNSPLTNENKKYGKMSVIFTEILYTINMLELIKWKPHYYLEEKDELGLQRIVLDGYEAPDDKDGNPILLSFESEYKDSPQPLQLYAKHKMRTAISYMNVNRNFYNQAKNMYIDYMKHGKQ